MADKIRLYGTTWCPYTNRSRKCLSNIGIDYDWYDIDKDEEACAFVEKVNRGNRTVPIILFPDGSVIVAPSDSELEEKCHVYNSR